MSQRALIESRFPPAELILGGREAIIDRPMSDNRTEILVRADNFQIFDNLIAQSPL
jgi:hypothetical protein